MKIERYNDNKIKSIDMNTMQIREINEEQRTIDVIFSSDKPANMGWEYPEVLLHTVEAIDFTRLKKVGSALFNHNHDIVVGSILEVKLYPDLKICTAKIQFDRDQVAYEIWQKVISGSIKGLSVGYMIHEVLKIEEGEKFQDYLGPMILVTRWEPYEISFTPIPADDNCITMRKINQDNNDVNDMLNSLNELVEEYEKENKELKTNIEKRKIKFEEIFKNYVNIKSKYEYLVGLHIRTISNPEIFHSLFVLANNEYNTEGFEEKITNTIQEYVSTKRENIILTQNTEKNIKDQYEVNEFVKNFGRKFKF